VALTYIGRKALDTSPELGQDSAYDMYNHTLAKHTHTVITAKLNTRHTVHQLGVHDHYINTLLICLDNCEKLHKKLLP